MRPTILVTLLALLCACEKESVVVEPVRSPGVQDCFSVRQRNNGLYRCRLIERVDNFDYARWTRNGVPHMSDSATCDMALFSGPNLIRVQLFYGNDTVECRMTVTI